MRLIRAWSAGLAPISAWAAGGTRTLGTSASSVSPTMRVLRCLTIASLCFSKCIRYCFDRVFEQKATQVEVFEQTALPLLPGLLDGFNATVFAYGVRLPATSPVET